jgi:hypothetical protein
VSLLIEFINNVMADDAGTSSYKYFEFGHSDSRSEGVCEVRAWNVDLVHRIHSTRREAASNRLCFGGPRAALNVLRLKLIFV